MPQKSLGRLIRVVALLMMGLAGSGAALAQKAGPAAQAQGAAVNGRNATLVNVGEGTTRTGEIRKVDGTRWLEFDAAGQAVFEFDEVKRDDSSVFLLDSSRGVTLQLDLRARKVTYSDAATRRRELYKILSATAEPVQQQFPGATQQQGMREVGSLTSRQRIATAPRVEAPAFCVNESVARGAGIIPGRIADCPAGYSMSGGSCKRAGDTIAAPSRAADCPAGYSNNGASCERPAATKANTNSRLADCPDGFTNSGDACFRLSAATPLPMSSMTCKGGEIKSDARCYKSCEAGFTNAGTSCTRPASTLGADSMTCKAGFKKSANGQRCVAECAAGYTNTGEACSRAADALGIESMVCKAGEVRKGGRCLPAAGTCAKGEVEQNGLCYKACAPGFEGIGSVCVAQSPKTWAQCGLGAAKDAQACSAAFFEPVAAVKHQALLVGTSSSAGGAIQKKFKDLTDAYDKAKDLPQFKKARDTWEQGNGKDAYPSLDKISAASGDDEMMKYAAQLAAIADLSGAATAVDASTYPKCGKLFPAK